jgi:hypothetical protein
MAGQQDLYNLYTAIMAATQSLSQLSKTLPRLGGYVYAFNNLSSGSFVTLVSSDNNRSTITFINPGTQTGMVAPLAIGSSNGVFAPTPGVWGGCTPVLPGDSLTITAGSSTPSGAQQGWQACVAATSTGGSSQPFTVMVQ